MSESFSPSKTTGETLTQGTDKEYRLISLNKLCTHIDDTLPIIPYVLLTIIADYTVPLDIYFSFSEYHVLSNYKRTLDYAGFLNHQDAFDTVFLLQQQISLTMLNWSFRIDQSKLPISEGPVFFGIMNNVQEYQEIRMNSRITEYSFVYTNNLSKSNKCDHMLSPYGEKSIISFSANLTRNTVSVFIDNDYYEDIFNVDDVCKWTPYVDVVSYRAAKITVGKTYGPLSAHEF